MWTACDFRGNQVTENRMYSPQVFSTFPTILPRGFLSRTTATPMLPNSVVISRSDWKLSHLSAVFETTDILSSRHFSFPLFWGHLLSGFFLLKPLLFLICLSLPPEVLAPGASWSQPPGCALDHLHFLLQTLALRSISALTFTNGCKEPWIFLLTHEALTLAGHLHKDASQASCIQNPGS